MKQLDVAIREGRGPDKPTGPHGVYLPPEGSFVGPLPLTVRRGRATLGVHTLDDRVTDYPRMRDGEITAAQLLVAASEFDQDPERWTATDFVMHLIPDIEGTEEYRQHQEARASLLALAGGKE